VVWHSGAAGPIPTSTCTVAFAAVARVSAVFRPVCQLELVPFAGKTTTDLVDRLDQLRGLTGSHSKVELEID